MDRRGTRKRQSPGASLAAVPAVPAGATDGRSGLASVANALPHGTFAGRDAELDELIHRVEAAAAEASRGDPVLVSGAPGIGKSRLISEAMDQLEGHGWRCVVGRTVTEMTAPPLWPWAQIIRTFLRSGGTDLASLVLDEPQGAERFEVFDAAAETLRAQAGDQPVLIVVEDVHAADVATVLLTRFVAAQLAAEKVAVVATSRPGASAAPEIETQLDAISRAAPPLELRGLDVDAVATLLDGTSDASVVHAVTGGNPLFVDQVASLGRATPRAAGKAKDAASDTDALVTMLQNRIALLASPARSTLETLAVLGGASEISTLADVHVGAGLDADTTAALDALSSAGLVHGVDADRVAVTHALVTEAARQTMEQSTARSLHQAAARSAAEDPDRVGEAAHHLVRAGPRHRRDAVVACQRAASRAAAATTHDAAADHLRDAVAVLDDAVAEVPGDDTGDQPMATTRLRVLLDLGRQLQLAGRDQEAVATFDDATVLARDLDDPEGMAEAALSGGVQYFFAYQREKIRVDRCREALDRLPATDSPLRARLLAHLAVQPPNGLHGPAEHAAAAEAVAIARRTDNAAALGYTLCAEQVTDMGPATLQRRLAAAREVIPLARDAQEPDLAAQARYLLLGSRLESGDLRGIDAELAGAQEHGGELADQANRRLTLWLRCTRALLAGDIARAQRAADDYHAVAMEQNDPYGTPIYGSQVAVIRWLEGRMAELEPLFEAQASSNPGEGVWWAAVAYMRAQAGRADEARAALEALGSFGGVPGGIHWLVSCTIAADAIALVGDRAQVDDAYAHLLPAADRCVPINAGAAFWGTVARRLGVLADRAGRPDEAVSHLERAIATCARLGARPWLAQAQLDLADVLLRSDHGDGGRAAELVTAAGATAAELGLGPWTERADRLAGLLCPSPPSAPATRAETGARPATAEQPSVTVLGAFAVYSAENREARWTSRKARELLKILIARRGSPVHREVLMDLLWPGEDPDTLGNRLSVALTTVRRAIDPDRAAETNHFVDADQGAVRIRLDRVHVDVEQFLALVQTGMAAHTRSPAGTADDAVIAALRAALDAHIGPALPDEPYAEWATPLQREVEVAHLQVAAALAERAEARGDHLAAADAYRHLAGANPDDEHAIAGMAAALERLRPGPG